MPICNLWYFWENFCTLKKTMQEFEINVYQNYYHYVPISIDIFVKHGFSKRKEKGYDTDTQIFKHEMKNFICFTQIHHDIKSSLFQLISSFHFIYFAYTDKLIMAQKMKIKFPGHCWYSFNYQFYWRLVSKASKGITWVFYLKSLRKTKCLYYSLQHMISNFLVQKT